MLKYSMTVKERNKGITNTHTWLSVTRETSNTVLLDWQKETIATTRGLAEVVFNMGRVRAQITLFNRFNSCNGYDSH